MLCADRLWPQISAFLATLKAPVSGVGRRGGGATA
jgi:hypothetical protein